MTEEKKVNRSGTATSIRLSPLGLNLWDQLASREGLNRTAYLEMTLRRLAAEKGIEAATIEAETKEEAAA